MTELDDEGWTYIESNFEQFNFNGEILAPKSVQKGAGSEKPCGLKSESPNCESPDSDGSSTHPIRDPGAPIEESKDTNSIRCS